MTNEDIRSYFNQNSVLPPANLAHVQLLPYYAQKIVEHYAAQTFTRVIMTIGSLGSNKEDEYSDVDLVLVCDNEGVPPEKDRINAINYISNNQASLDDINLQIWNFGTADDFTISGQEICTQFFTKKFLEDKVDLTVRGFYNQIGIEHPLASLSSLLNATVHLDKDNYYPYLRSKLAPYPESLRQIILSQELEMRFPYYLNRLNTAARRGDIPFANKMINQAIDSAVYILFAQYRRFPNGPKRLFEQLDAIAAPKIAKHFKHLFVQLVEQGTTNATLPKKQILLQKLLTLLKHNDPPA